MKTLLSPAGGTLPSGLISAPHAPSGFFALPHQHFRFFGKDMAGAERRRGKHFFMLVLHISQCRVEFSGTC